MLVYQRVSLPIHNGMLEYPMAVLKPFGVNTGLPIKILIFHNFLYVYQAGYPCKSPQNPSRHPTWLAE